jgi:hypothetical protein
VEYRLLADLVVVAHFAFILFVIAGGLLVLRWPRTAWLHLPAVVWAAYAELSGSICPLTPLEHAFRAAAGGQGYEGDFIDYYLVPLIYPPGLTRHTQTILAVVLIGLNLALYSLAWRRLKNPQNASGQLRRV